MSRVSVKPTEDGTLIIDVIFSDPDYGTDIVIKNKTWTLTDEHGNIINGRENVSFSDTIYLKDDDLSISRTKIDFGIRVFKAKAIYDNQKQENLSAIKEFEFIIKKLKTKKI